MTVASFVAARRTDHGVAHVICCRGWACRSRGFTSGASGVRRRASSARLASSRR
jgi:hypothetical protein